MQQVQQNIASQTSISVEIDFKCLKCISGNKALMACSTQDCLYPGLMCADADHCQCSLRHINCYNILIRNIEQKYKSKRQTYLELKQKMKSSFSQCQSLLNEAIKQFSKLKDQFYDLQENIFLSQGEIDFNRIFKQQKFQQINSEVIRNMLMREQYQILNKQEQIVAFKEQFMEELQQLFEKIREKCFITVNPIQMVRFQQEERVKQWLNQSTKKNTKSFELVYQASENQFSVKKFHQNCDQKRNLLVILKNQFEKIIGGFSPLSWKNKKNQFKHDQSHSSFIFSLSMNQKFQCVDYKRSILCFQDAGPCFGGFLKDGKYYSLNLIIQDKANIKHISNAGLSTNYNNKNNYQNDQSTRLKFTGAPDGYFKIKQWQVYEVLFYD